MKPQFLPSFRRLASCSLLVSSLLGAQTAAAQTPPPPPPAQPAMTPMTRPAPPALKLENADASLKLGLLMQPAYEMAGNGAANGVTHNLFVRRVRLLAGATLFKDVEAFFDTDFADLFKGAQDTGTKNGPGMYVQDAFGTYKALGDALKIDMGFMLPPSTHNALQGAGTLYGWDYFSNSFRNSNAFNAAAAPVGRDAGVELRGLVLDNMLEYRAGLFQGRRNPADAMAGRVGGRNFFRFASRLQVNVFDPETGFFYAGTYLGAKRVLSFGATFDIQNDYIHYGFDGFADLPLGPGLLTAQVNFAHYDGDNFLVGAAAPPMPAPQLLPKQNSLMAEAGYLIDAVDVSPIVRLERQWINTNDTGETRFALGAAFWPYGHGFNLKGFYSRVIPDVPNTHAFNQLNIQAQVYVF